MKEGDRVKFKHKKVIREGTYGEVDSKKGYHQIVSKLGTVIYSIHESCIYPEGPEEGEDNGKQSIDCQGQGPGQSS